MQTKLLLHNTQKRKRKGNQGGKTKEKGENNFIKFHVVYKIISALEFRHKQVP